MSLALISVYIFTSRLDAVLAARGELDAAPVSATSFTLPSVQNGSPNRISSGSTERQSVVQKIRSFGQSIPIAWQALMQYITGRLERWTGPKDDKQIAWTLGIGWACCGGGLAGGCLVFAKATWV